MMSTTPTITQSHVDKACGELHKAKVHDYLQLKNVDICNKAIEIALAEQQEITEFAKKRSGMEFDEWQGKPPLQESEYITAAQARELGAGKAEWSCEINGEHWYACTDGCVYASHSQITGVPIKYRAIKQAQPEPVDPHAALRAEYAKQVAEGTTGFYLWEYKYELQKEFITLDYSRFVGFNIAMHPDHNYRYTDISCYISKDGEPAIRMLRTEAQELQRKTKDTHDWRDPRGADWVHWAFSQKGTYTYRTKATIKLDGNMVTPEQAAAEWEAKKDTHDLYSCVGVSGWHESKNPQWYANAEYELRPKQPTWTGSRDDVIALLKELELIK
jgi:hypothetical protein